MVPIATAADGGGSIRIPAAFCGLFGFKGTYGRVPISELNQFGMALFIHCVHFGPVARSVADAALYMDVVMGEHPADPFSLPRPVGPSMSELVAVPPPPGLRIGFAQTLGTNAVAEKEAVTEAVRAVQALAAALPGPGVTLDLNADTFVQLPDFGLDWVKMMGTQERLALQPHKHHDETSDDDSTDAAAAATRRLDSSPIERSLLKTWEMLERVVTIEDVGATQRKAFELHAVLAAAFKRVDLLATLAMPVDAFQAESSTLPRTLSDGETDFESPMAPVFSMTPFNMSGHPACVLRTPGGNSRRTGMPWAVQLVAAKHADGLLFAVAAAYERATGAFAEWPTFDAGSGGFRKAAVARPSNARL